MKAHPISPLAILRSVRRNRGLVFALAEREVLGRYRGSVLGLAWSFFHPLLMLAIYTFVFSVVFEIRWPGGSGSKEEFALLLFSALITFNIFAECVNRAPTLVLGNATYATKIIFPLEILPLVTLLPALFHAAIGLVVWILFYAVSQSALPPLTILLYPVVLLPLALLSLGLGWFLGSLGVYLRDVAQVTSVCTTMLMFLSPIFYSIQAVPAQFQAAMRANPLTTVVEQGRDVMMWGRLPDWADWSAVTLASMVVAALGFAWFQKTRKGFADVL